MALNWGKFGELGRWAGWMSPPVVSHREGYALWADTYPPHPHNPLMQAEQTAVTTMLAALTPRRALDVGTGTGRNLPLLASAGARLIVGADMSLPMLEHRQCRTPRVCGDACRLPFAEASFDLVCSSLMVGDVENLGGWIGEARRVLAPRGHLVYSDFHPSWAEQKWRRTFRASNGSEFALNYFPHAIEDHLTRLEAAGLSVRTIREPRLPGVPAPVVVVFHAIRR